MIPEQAIVEWRREAPWTANAMIEQDLIMEDGGHAVTRALFEANLHEKAGRSDFRGDMVTLLRSGLTWDFDSALLVVLEELVARLPGEPWQGGSQ